MIDEELLREFIIESGEHLVDFEANLNGLIDEPENTELLNQVFRAIHSIKGSADYLGLEKTGGFLHSLEGILEELRSGDMRLTKDVLNVLFLGMDTVKSLLTDISKGVGEGQIDIVSAQESVENILKGVGEEYIDVLELEEVNDKEVGEMDIYEGLDTLDDILTEDKESQNEMDIYEGLDTLDGILTEDKESQNEMDIYEGYELVDGIIEKEALEAKKMKEEKEGEEVDIYEGFEVAVAEKEKRGLEVIGGEVDGRESTKTGFFDEDIEVVLNEHILELEKAVKRLEETKARDELENLQKLINSFCTSIEYFGFDDLNTILSGIVRTVHLMFEEGEKVTDTEVLYFYNTMDQIKGFITGEGFSKIAGSEDLKSGDPFYRELTIDEAVMEFTIVPGVGGAKARSLYKKGIKSLKVLSEARVEELEAIDGINLNLARDICAYFRDKQPDEKMKPVKIPPPPTPPPTTTPPLSYIERKSESLKYREEVKGDIVTGYDTELVDIFLTATVDLFSILEIDLESIKAMEADESVLREVLDVAARLKRSAKYMEYDNIESKLEEVYKLTSKYLQNKDEFTKGEVDILVKGLLDLREGLRKSKIILDRNEAGVIDSEDLSEEDKELVQIFLSATDQYMDTLLTCLLNFKEDKNVDETIEIYQKALESLYSSAKFMGYDTIINNLEKQLNFLTKDVSSDAEGPKLFKVLEIGFKELKEEVEGVSRLVKILHAVEPEVEKISFRKEPVAKFEEQEDIFEEITSEEEEKKVQVTEVREERPEIVAEEPTVQKTTSKSYAPQEPDIDKTLSEADGVLSSTDPVEDAPPPGGGGEMPPGDDGEPPGTDFAYSKQTLRVETERVDSIMNLVGELVVNKASFSQLYVNFKEVYRDLVELKKLDKLDLTHLKQLSLNIESTTMELERVSNELQEGVMRVRMVGINQLFSRFPRLVRDLADKMNKKVKITITGRETELDKSVIEEIGDPLIHIIRNAIDHGLESTADRKKNKKPEVGEIEIKAYHQGNQVVIEVKDDGQGIDIDEIKERMVENDEITEVEKVRISNREAINYLFKPGISMAKKISNVSGRGVGLDIVKKNIEKLNGNVEVLTERGIGTTFMIKLPLTLAIIQALIVNISDKVYSIPLSAVTETVRVNVEEIDTIEGHQVLRLREKVLPLLNLSDIFKMNYGLNIDTGDGEPDVNQVFVVVLSAEGREVGLIVDKLVGEEDIVIKSLEEYLSDTRGVSGASIMGDGSISLILDVIELVNLAIEKEKEMRRKQMRERLKRRNSKLKNNNVTPLN